VLHDAEDVVHRDELRVFAHQLSDLAMVQLPVEPLPDAGSRWIAGHYLDEFAEAHGKEIIVRAALGAAVPSAGVACAIDRDVLGRLAAMAGGAPFDPHCLTEDYELGHRIHALGLRAALVRVRSGEGVATVATREHFPATLDAAVRQKARWLLGIALQGWDRLGWRGGWADRWMLVRDRKGVITAALALAGYAALAAALLLGAIRSGYPPLAAAPPLVEPGGVTALLLTFNLGALGWRLAMRALFTGRVHGWRQGLRAPPRAVVANVVNFLAAVRALRRYVAIGLGRERQRWDKTRHLVHRQRA
jgi:adsorption protein B